MDVKLIIMKPQLLKYMLYRRYLTLFIYKYNKLNWWMKRIKQIWIFLLCSLSPLSLSLSLSSLLSLSLSLYIYIYIYIYKTEIKQLTFIDISIHLFTAKLMKCLESALQIQLESFLLLVLLRSRAKRWLIGQKCDTHKNTHTYIYIYICVCVCVCVCVSHCSYIFVQRCNWRFK